MAEAKKETTITEKQKVYQSVGGTDTYLYMTIHYQDENGKDKDMHIWLGSIISISYSVYRNKKTVHNLGHKVISGFAIGPRYVAGTIIKAMFMDDDIMTGLSVLRNKLKDQHQYSDVLTTLNLAVVPSQLSNLMLDDIASFDINIIYTSEYPTYKAIEQKVITETIIGATFINNGQTMSVNDLITETTISYIAKDVQQFSEITDTIRPLSSVNSITTATSLLL